MSPKKGPISDLRLNKVFPLCWRSQVSYSNFAVSAIARTAFVSPTYSVWFMRVRAVVVELRFERDAEMQLRRIPR